MPSLEQRISQRLEAFVSEITELARQRAIEIFSASFVAAERGGGGAAWRVRDGGRVAGSAAYVHRFQAEMDRRRSPEEIDRVQQVLLEQIKATPGLRVEQIGKALGAPSKDLTLPLKKLLAQKLVRRAGQRRATRYFPAK